MNPQIMDEQAPAAGTTAIDPADLNGLLDKEWLLTNQRGSYASGTVLGCNTRRYHGLLIASLRPPVERVVMLSNLLETVEIAGEKFELSTFEFSDRLHPQGYRFLQRFRRDEGVHFEFEAGGMSIVKSVYLCYEDDVLVVRYTFRGGVSPVRFILMPMAAMRDFHATQSSSASLQVTLTEENIVTVHGLNPADPAMHLLCRGASFDRGADWWYAMRYRMETRRGQHDYEDVWAPGAFSAEFTGDREITLVAAATPNLSRPGPMDLNAEDAADRLRGRRQELITLADAQDDIDHALTMAADQFIVRRRINETKDSTTILAGYHWFADWGRDAFIALPGLLLCTGRFAEAREVLATFAGALDEGMIPNRFDDYGGPPHYNSVDASLWYVNAAYQYFLVSEDHCTFNELFRSVLAEILTCYERGTRDNIHADTDGLITAGDEHTQLTWMDAKCGGIVFTPRYGKPVEINALWINGLNIMAETAHDDAERQRWAEKAQCAEESFNRLFWNPAEKCLFDCIFPDGRPDGAVRPNQIFAVSLPFSPLSLPRQQDVIAAVRKHLWTPFGLRSLSPRDSRYRGRYEGDQFSRDSAYHQGTVWAWLMGPFIEAFLKVNKFSAEARKEAADMLEGLQQHLFDNACLGSISEVFDGDPPHRPGACIAQAWSVAELLRARRLLR
ncbi:MAG: glycogen debranching enzyme family protein [Sedimentisphaerales bacterium]|nr:glycogen debranching enzyme family protein [Sedimentisphaerales bacterium]